MNRFKLARFATVVAVTALALAGCSSSERDTPSAGGTAEIGSTNDINPQEVSNLRQGGNLRLALTAFPSNFNPLHLDGNTGDVGSLTRPTLPRAFVIAADGSATVNTDYFTDIELTGTDPQVVTYTINPEAVWSDGTPITWEDIKSQAEANSGKNPEFVIAAPNGFERVASVTRGTDDRQAVMTFDKPYADWKGMFAGNGRLLPKSMTATPEAFNKGQLDAPGPSAGPFMVTNVDRGAQRITLSRNPNWWGTPPVLDTITYLVLDDAARIPALQNNTIDATGTASLDELTIARSTAGISIRRAPSASWYHLTFNGAPGSILADPALRRAVAKGIDRQAIANITQRGLTDNPVPLNNHIFVAGQKGYQDNAGSVAFDPDQARAELDALGWIVPEGRQFRQKDGKELVIRNVFYDAGSTRQVAQITQNMLGQIGVNLQLDTKPGTGFFSNYIIKGDFDVSQFAFLGDAFPLSSLTQIYTRNGASNFGKIGSPEIDAKIEQTLEELDSAKALDLANELDQMLFDEVFSLPLFQSPGNVAVRSNLANFGAFGLADPDYTTIGFVK